MKTDECLRSPFGNLRTALPCFLVFYVAEGIAPAGATRGLSDRPLDPFGAATFWGICCLIPIITEEIPPMLLICIESFYLLF